MSRVCYVQCLLCLEFDMSSLRYVYRLLCLFIVISSICYGKVFLGIMFVMSRVCCVQWQSDLGFIVSNVCLSWVCYITLYQVGSTVFQCAFSIFVGVLINLGYVHTIASSLLPHSEFVPSPQKEIFAYRGDITPPRIYRVF